MTVSERRKGLVGQQEVQRLFRSFGVELDKLAAQGDRVWTLPNGQQIRLEVKNQTKRGRMPAWIAQSQAETPRTMVAAVAWKHRDRWRIDIDAEDLLEALK